MCCDKYISFTKTFICCLNFTYFRCNNQSVKKVIFSFIWGKRDRIKRNTLVLCQNEGGTCLIDIECKINSLKAAWVKYFVYENNVSNYINAISKQYNIEIPNLLKLDNFSVFVL